MTDLGKSGMGAIWSGMCALSGVGIPGAEGAQVGKIRIDACDNKKSLQP